MDGKALVHMDVEGARQVSSRSTLSHHSADKIVSVVCQPMCVFAETLGFWFDLPVCSHWLYIFSFFCSASPSMWPRCRWPRTWWIWSTATAAWRKTRTTPSSTDQTRVRWPGFLLTIKGQNDSKPLLLIVRDLFVPPRCHFTKCPSWYSWRVSEPWRSQWVLKIWL